MRNVGKVSSLILGSVLSICLECILKGKKVGWNDGTSRHFAAKSRIQGKGIQCLQKLREIMRDVIISRKSQIPNGRYAMSRSSYGCRVGRRNRFYLMTDYLLCSQAERILTWFSCFNNTELLI